MTRAFIFPGQGSHLIGMGKALAEAFAPARDVFQEVDDALNQKLSKIMWEGPEDELLRTPNAQPAIMAVSMAIVRIMQKEGGLDLSKHARLVAGHSLGEYSALCAAGAFTLAETARLLRARGDAMESATPVGAGGMSALLGAEIDQAEAVAKQCAEAGGGVCVVANDNAPGQVVISGTKAAIDKAPEIAKALGVKRAMALNVAAPFHSPLMQPAADKMREVLAAATIRPLSCPLVANVTATETSEPETIRRLLVEQVTGRVRWRESILAFKGYGVTTTVEATAKDTVTAMVKRIDKDLATVLLVSPADIEAFVKAL